MQPTVLALLSVPVFVPVSSFSAAKPVLGGKPVRKLNPSAELTSWCFSFQGGSQEGRVMSEEEAVGSVASATLTHCLGFTVSSVDALARGTSESFCFHLRSVACVCISR